MWVVRKVNRSHILLLILLLVLLRILYHMNSSGTKAWIYEHTNHSLGDYLGVINDHSTILIAVISSASHFQERMAIRNNLGLWKIEDIPMSNKDHVSYWNMSLGCHENVSVQVVFMLARSPDSLIHHYVLLESKEFKDIWLGDFIDSYENLPHKTMLTLKIFTKLYTHTKYLLKIDDNVGLNLAILLDVLKTVPKTDFILGHVLNESAPIRKQCYMKWYLTKDIYNQSTFPAYTTGPAYILTFDAAKQILSVCPEVGGTLHLEDVVFTGLCREKAGVEFVNNEQFCQRYMSPDQKCATKHRRVLTEEEKRHVLSMLAK